MRKQKLRRTNTTGIAGVSYCTTRGRWVANINTDVGRLTFFVPDLFEACCIRKSLENVHGYETIQ